MITGTLYVNEIDGTWESGPAAYIGADPSNSDRVVVVYFPTPPNDPVVPMPAVVVSARTASEAPTDGEYIYVAD
tara:strand:- start:5132 stop:5353 length:222 start_codon:yes stop_codon:yes gene_type:complete